MNFLKSIGRKALHGLYVAAGAVGTTLAATLVGGPVLGAAALAKLGAAAFVGYMVKPARPAPPQPMKFPIKKGVL
jgi:hypothetical protein